MDDEVDQFYNEIVKVFNLPIGAKIIVMMLSRAEALKRAPSSFSIGSNKFGSSEDVHVLGYIKIKNRTL